MSLEIDVAWGEDSLLHAVGNDLFKEMLNTLLAFENATALSRGERFEFLVAQHGVAPQLPDQADIALVHEQEQACFGRSDTLLAFKQAFLVCHLGCGLTLFAENLGFHSLLPIPLHPTHVRSE